MKKEFKPSNAKAIFELECAEETIHGYQRDWN